MVVKLLYSTGGHTKRIFHVTRDLLGSPCSKPIYVYKCLSNTSDLLVVKGPRVLHKEHNCTSLVYALYGALHGSTHSSCIRVLNDL